MHWFQRNKFVKFIIHSGPVPTFLLISFEAVRRDVFFVHLIDDPVPLRASCQNNILNTCFFNKNILISNDLFHFWAIIFRFLFFALCSPVFHTLCAEWPLFIYYTILALRCTPNDSHREWSRDGGWFLLIDLIDLIYFY